jgi:hypothetical protein
MKKDEHALRIVDRLAGNSHALYLFDLGYLLRGYTAEAIKNAQADPEDEYAAGYSAGLLRAIDVMQQQADGFGIPLEELRLEGVDADNQIV